ncbi:UDP binding domain-containing protein [Bacillus cytotoxicus]|uniref:UDP binding domain-containing protein n=1 Tax=Bacillus cereus group TaxID=86661 RepID=UPI001F5998D6|nr:UDP-glucose/GDP-mannose dehydrogenase family protein [Bacillus cereus group sp. BfR-BA-01522]
MQNYFDIDQKVNVLKKDINNLIVCDPITSLLTKDINTELNQIIFNFSGLETPFMKNMDDLLLYPKTIFENAYEALNESKFDRIIVTGNDKVMTYLKKEYGNKFRGEFKHLSHEEFLIELQNSKMLVSSPGLTATYEAMAYNVPVRFLPPQNYSQALMKSRKYFDSFKGLNVAILGLTFKPDTDDLREAPSLENIPIMLKEGANVNVWDPVGIENFKKIYPDEITYSTSIEDTIKNADICFIFTEWYEIKEFDISKYSELMKTPIVLDGRNCYDLKGVRKTKIIYDSIGRETVSNLNLLGV